MFLLKRGWAYTSKYIFIVLAILVYSLSFNPTRILAAPVAETGEVFYTLSESDAVYDVFTGSSQQDAYDGLWIKITLPKNVELSFRLRSNTGGGCIIAAAYEDGSWNIDQGHFSTTRDDNWAGTTIVSTAGWVAIFVRAEDCQPSVKYPIEVYFEARTSPASSTPETTEPPPTEPPPTDPPTTEPPPSATVDFWAEDYDIERGQCTVVHWRVAHGTVYWEGQSTHSAAQAEVCPAETTTYKLEVQGEDGQWHNESLTIYVEELVATTPPPIRTPYVLAVTHSENLNTQVDTADAWAKIETWLDDYYEPLDTIDLYEEGVVATDWEAIRDTIHSRIRTYPGNPEYLLIIGGPAVVAFGQLPNPTEDGDTLYTDDVYGNTVADADDVPDIPVARLPDGGDFGLYELQFGRKELSNAGFQGTNYHSGYAFGHHLRPYAQTISDLIQASNTIWVPPTLAGTWLNGLHGKNIYFILHGSDEDTSQWWGDTGEGKGSDRYPVGWDRGYSTRWENVVSGACYGAYIGTPSDPRAPFESISLSFLSNGTRAFMGYTVTAYSLRARKRTVSCSNGSCKATFSNTRDNVEEGNAYLGYTTYQSIMSGDHPLDAFWKAKMGMANSLGPSRAQELKIMHGFTFYGLPPVNDYSRYE